MRPGLYARLHRPAVRPARCLCPRHWNRPPRPARRRSAVSVRF